MKKIICIIFITLVICNSQEINAAQRRAGLQSTRKILNNPVSKATGALGRTPVIKSKSAALCPSASKKSLAQTLIVPHENIFKTKVHGFAQKHRKKLLITGLAGTACAGKAISNYTQHKKICENLMEFDYMLKSYDDSKQAQENLDAIILRLEENGINHINENGDTPLMMVIATPKLTPTERKKILKDLLAHGAKPGLKELDSSINALNNHLTGFSVDHAPVKPYLITLKVLLPYYKQEVLNVFMREIHKTMSNISKEILDQKLAYNNMLHEERDTLFKVYQEKINSPEFALLSKQRQKRIQVKYNNAIEIIDRIFTLKQQEFRKEEEQKIQPKLELLKRVQNIAKKALNKGKLSGTSAYKEVD